MTRIGGRSMWLAAPAGLLCLGVVTALVWLALPMFPVAMAWVGDTLRTATTPRPVAVETETPAQQMAEGALDCRDLYPGDLWGELTWRRGTLLSQTAAPPVTAVTSLTEALAPTTNLTCSWRQKEGGGAIVTTLSVVGDDAVSIADAALRGQGFSCAAAMDGVRCVRERGRVIEEHTVRGSLWLASVETGWQPEDYGARVEAHVWG